MNLQGSKMRSFYNGRNCSSLWSRFFLKCKSVSPINGLCLLQLTNLSYQICGHYELSINTTWWRKLAWDGPCCNMAATWEWIPWPEWGKASALRPIGEANHTARAKLQSKKICLSSSGLPQREQCSSTVKIILWILEAVPRVSLRSLHTNILTRGWIILSAHKHLRIYNTLLEISTSMTKILMTKILMTNPKLS